MPVRISYVATFLGSKTGVHWMEICNTCTFHSSAPNLECDPPRACWENFIRTHVQWLEQKCEKFYPCKPYFLLYKLWFIRFPFIDLFKYNIGPTITPYMLVDTCNITWKFDPWHSGNSIYRWKWNNWSWEGSQDILSSTTECGQLLFSLILIIQENLINSFC